MEATLRLQAEPVVETSAEDALVGAAVGGDASAFAALYDRHLARVYRHVLYRVGSRADAEDLTQQVFLRAWHAVGRYRQREVPFVAWLFTIAHNLVVDFRRQRSDADPLDLDVAAAARWSDPEAEAFAAYDRAAVRRAILKLKPELQQVLILRFVEGMSAADVAAAVGKSEGNVRVIQHRALAELRRRLEHEVKA